MSSNDIDDMIFDLNDVGEVVNLDIMCSSSKSDSHLPEKYVIK